MEEELNENDLEGRLYSMLYYADDTQANFNDNQKDVLQLIENAPRNAVRRYWRTSEDNSPYQKVNTPKEPPVNRNTIIDKNDSKPREEKRNVVTTPAPANSLSMFQSPVPHNLKKTVEIVENDEDTHIVELQSSDEDEVIEVALPPKPTITIESSDEEEICAIVVNKATDKDQDKKSPEKERAVSASPVPSVVSSVSDEFIRGDCIALNISSRHPNRQSFDFSLHGSDLLVQTPSKKKKRTKNKEVTLTPSPSLGSTLITNVSPITDKECFATPKSKAKNKRQRNKSYLVSEKSIPNPDVYDSDSNQSSELNKNTPDVSNKTIPSANVYESDSNQSEAPSEPKKSKQTNSSMETPQKTISVEKQNDVPSKTPKRIVPVDTPNNVPSKTSKRNSVSEASNPVVDLTSPEHDTSVLSINENIIMGNVTGFSEPEYYEDLTPLPNDDPKLGSTKVPAILFADLDFNNLNGKQNVCKKRRYSLSTLRAEMEKFYNESWGGENFNHREIQKYMSRDKSLWVIDPKDKMSALTKRKVICNYCNRQGHREDNCRLKPPVCHMCGSVGHKEPRCPRKICVNCGSPNHMYSSMCRNCYGWQGTRCGECGQAGHPATHCPDIWRRYHNTISEDMQMEENHQTKKHYQMFCSGCTRRGHLVHTCRVSLPFSGLPINSPYVVFYNPVYEPTNTPNRATSQPNTPTRNNQDDTITSASTPHNRNKRQSNSPVVHETHLNKRRNVSTDATDEHVAAKSPVDGQKRKRSQSKDPVEDARGATENTSNGDPKTVTVADTVSTPDFIPITSGNHDKQGQIIQDNEVSDTSEVVTSARIYVTSAIMEKLNNPEGVEWLSKTSEKNNVTIQQTADVNTYLSIKGTVGDQEAFQTELRDCINNKVNGELLKADNSPLLASDAAKNNDVLLSDNIPKNRNNVLRVISKALDSLKNDLGDPNTLYKEYNYLQNQHMQLLKQKVISTKQLTNNRANLNYISRKLNMILLGQAGLADGPKHLNELCSLHEKITNYRQKIIPLQLREEIGQHYHSIFTCTPRADYADLLNNYYISKKSPVFSIFKKNDRVKQSPKPKEKNINQVWPNNLHDGIEAISAARIDADKIPHMKMKRLLAENTVNKLVFIQRRLQQAQPTDIIRKKTREILLKKFEAYILLYNRNPFPSAKVIKRTKKVQEQARLFLTNL